MEEFVSGISGLCVNELLLIIMISFFFFGVKYFIRLSLLGCSGSAGSRGRCGETRLTVELPEGEDGKLGPSSLPRPGGSHTR